MSGYESLTTQCLQFLAQSSQRFKGLQGFRNNFDYSVIQIIVSLLVVPLLGYGILHLIRFIQDRKKEQHGFDEVIKGLGLTNSEASLVEEIAHSARLPAPARIVQSQDCFSESVNAFVRRDIDSGVDPRLDVQAIERIREKLGFQAGSGSNTPEATQDLDLPQRAKARLVRSESQTEDVDVVLFQPTSAGLRLVGFDPGLEATTGGVREDDEVEVDILVKRALYSFTATITARRSIRGRMELTVSHSTNISFVQDNTRQSSEFERTMIATNNDLSSGTPTSVTLEQLNSDIAQFITPSALPIGATVELSSAEGGDTASATVITSDRAHQGSYRIVVSLDRKSPSFPESLDQIEGSSTGDFPVSA